MALFGGGKAASLPNLLKKVQAHEYTTNAELGRTLAEIDAHADLRARSILFMLSDSNPKVREFASQRMERLAGKKLLALLVDAMLGIEPKLRREIAELAAQSPMQALCDALAPLVHSKLEDERLIALEIIGVHPLWPEFLSFLKSALKDSQAQVRRRSVRILRRGCKNPTIRLILLELLHDDDDAIRHEAIAALAAEPQPDIVEPFFARLPEEGRESQSFMVRALAKLASEPEAKLEERLLPILASEELKLREVAVKLLASIPNRTKVLRAYLLHSRGLATWLRERTHASILRMADNLIEPLIELMRDSDDDVRVGAMVMAAGSEDARIVPIVKEIFASDDDWWIRSIAADVLAKFPGSEVTDALLAKIADPDLRYSVITVLGSLLDERTVPVLVECLRDGSRGVRIVTLEALRKTHEALGESRTVEATADAILALAKDDSERTVQEKAADVLRAFGPHAKPRLVALGKYEDVAAQEAKRAITSELQMENDSLNS